MVSLVVIIIIILHGLVKQADEITMILANYYGMSGLIDLGYSKSTTRKTITYIQYIIHVRVYGVEYIDSK